MSKEAQDEDMPAPGMVRCGEDQTLLGGLESAGSWGEEMTETKAQPTAWLQWEVALTLGLRLWSEAWGPDSHKPESCCCGYWLLMEGIRPTNTAKDRAYLMRWGQQREVVGDS